MKLQKLFDVVICKNPISKSFADENPGATPYVTTTSENNGVECFVDYPAQYPADLITVSKDGGSADAFLQTEPFCGNEKVMVLLPKQKMSKHESLFYTYVINANKYKFAYGRKCSVARLKEVEVPKVSDIPEWVYNMNISKVSTNNVANEYISLNINEWVEFRFGRLITSIYKSKSINKDALTEKIDGIDTIQYITRTCENNGCEMLADINDIDSDYIEASNAISIGDTTATCFYQPEQFITGDHMVIVRADWMNEYNALFVVAILSNEQFKYSYGRAFLMDRVKDTIIKLPIKKNQDGTPFIDNGKKYSDNGYVPDWKFMEEYIRTLPYGDRLET